MYPRIIKQEAVKFFSYSHAKFNINKKDGTENWTPVSERCTLVFVYSHYIALWMPLNNEKGEKKMNRMKQEEEKSFLIPYIQKQQAIYIFS